MTISLHRRNQTMMNRTHRLTAALVLLAAILSACQAAPAVAPEDFQISLELKPCFGTCPVYVLSVAADGGVVYEGTNFVLVEGRQTASAEAEAVAALYAAVLSADFFALEEGYAYPATDLPTAITTVTAGGRTHTISRYGGACGSDLDVAPQALCEVETLMEAIAVANGWVTEN
jgi:hypothetical protein